MLFASFTPKLKIRTSAYSFSVRKLISKISKKKKQRNIAKQPVKTRKKEEKENGNRN